MNAPQIPNFPYALRMLAGITRMSNGDPNWARPMATALDYTAERVEQFIAEITPLLMTLPDTPPEYLDVIVHTLRQVLAAEIRKDAEGGAVAGIEHDGDCWKLHAACATERAAAIVAGSCV